MIHLHNRISHPYFRSHDLSSFSPSATWRCCAPHLWEGARPLGFEPKGSWAWEVPWKHSNTYSYDRRDQTLQMAEGLKPRSCHSLCVMSWELVNQVGSHETMRWDEVDPGREPADLLGNLPSTSFPPGYILPLQLFPEPQPLSIASGPLHPLFPRASFPRPFLLQGSPPSAWSLLWPSVSHCLLCSQPRYMQGLA